VEKVTGKNPSGKRGFRPIEEKEGILRRRCAPAHSGKERFGMRGNRDHIGWGATKSRKGDPRKVPTEKNNQVQLRRWLKGPGKLKKGEKENLMHTPSIRKRSTSQKFHSEVTFTVPAQQPAILGGGFRCIRGGGLKIRHVVRSTAKKTANFPADCARQIIGE